MPPVTPQFYTLAYQVHWLRLMSKHDFRKYNFETAQETLRTALHDLSVIAGDIVGDSGASWQDYAGTAVLNLHALANLITKAREGVSESPIVFPSPSECLEEGKE